MGVDVAGEEQAVGREPLGHRRRGGGAGRRAGAARPRPPRGRRGRGCSRRTSGRGPGGAGPAPRASGRGRGRWGGGPWGRGLYRPAAGLGGMGVPVSAFCLLSLSLVLGPCPWSWVFVLGGTEILVCRCAGE